MEPEVQKTVEKPVTGATFPKHLSAKYGDV
jgi:hypothetical protein